MLRVVRRDQSHSQAVVAFFSADLHPLSVQQLQWHALLALFPECSKTFTRAFWCVHSELALKTAESERKIYIRTVLLFGPYCVSLCVCNRWCSLWSSQYVQLSPLLHTSWCGFAHRITNYSLHSNTLLPAHNLHERKMFQCHTRALIEVDTLTLLWCLKDCALKGHFLFVSDWQAAAFLFICLSTHIHSLS